jgi:hypothetical protein
MYEGAPVITCQILPTAVDIICIVANIIIL